MTWRLTVPEAAWIVMLPEVPSGSTRVAVATPPTVPTDCETVPFDAVKTTIVPFATGWLKLSTTVATICDELPQLTEAGATSVMNAGMVDVHETDTTTEFVAFPEFACTTMLPLKFVDVVSVTVATPPTVVALADPPRLVKNWTNVPSITGCPRFVVTVALTMIVVPHVIGFAERPSCIDAAGPNVAVAVGVAVGVRVGVGS